MRSVLSLVLMATAGFALAQNPTDAPPGWQPSSPRDWRNNLGDFRAEIKRSRPIQLGEPK